MMFFSNNNLFLDKGPPPKLEFSRTSGWTPAFQNVLHIAIAICMYV